MTCAVEKCLAFIPSHTIRQKISSPSPMMHIHVRDSLSELSSLLNIPHSIRDFSPSMICSSSDFVAQATNQLNI